jgi:glutaredoxin 3
MRKVSIYSTPTCHFCSMAKDFFQSNSIEFEDFDVSVDEEKRNEMIDKSGQMGVPVINIDGEIVVGFNEGKIRKLLGL